MPRSIPQQAPGVPEDPVTGTGMHVRYMHRRERGTMTDGDLQRLDHALLRLRRMWDAPAGVEHEGRVVDGSTLLVCVAVEEHRAVASGAGAVEVGVLEVAQALGVTHSTASRLVSRA